MFSICIWLGKTFLKIIWWQFLVPSAQNISCVSSATLLRKTKSFDYVNVSAEYTIANCIIQIAFSKKFLTAGLLSS